MQQLTVDIDLDDLEISPLIVWNFLLDQFEASPFTLKLDQNFESLGESPYTMEVIAFDVEGDDFDEAISPHGFLKMGITRDSPYKVFEVSCSLDGQLTPDQLMTMLSELCEQINTCQLLKKIIEG